MSKNTSLFKIHVLKDKLGEYPSAKSLTYLDKWTKDSKSVICFRYNAFFDEYSFMVVSSSESDMQKLKEANFEWIDKIEPHTDLMLKVVTD